ncbi:MAG: hypothetical protein MRQ13_04830 [Candidatus Midichloria sp.]|nr:hypothetical protein [Candidatus Midichloria sp.]
MGFIFVKSPFTNYNYLEEVGCTYLRLLLVLLSINLTINKAVAAESDYLHYTKAINFYEERYKLPC